MRRRALLMVLTLPAAAAKPAPAADADSPSQETLLDRLRAGGLVVLLRHARTEPGTGDPPGFRLDDCATQRNLDAAGRKQARAIGAALRAERVPVGRVLSSRWCRCLDTARLLDLGEAEPFPAIDSFFADTGRREPQTEATRAFVRGWQGPGNAILVTHQVNITALTEVFPASGEGAVVEPSTLSVVGRLRLA